MQEVIDAETLVIFAPTWLSREIDEHTKNIAADTEVSEQRVVEEWRELAQHIHFYEPEISNTNKQADCADPDDLPYKLVRHPAELRGSTGPASRFHFALCKRRQMSRAAGELWKLMHARASLLPPPYPVLNLNSTQRDVVQMQNVNAPTTSNSANR